MTNFIWFISLARLGIGSLLLRAESSSDMGKRPDYCWPLSHDGALTSKPSGVSGMVMGGKVLYFERDRQRMAFKEHRYATFFGVRRGIETIVAPGDHGRRREHAVRPN